jgi:uncharacterized SAM-binding protein YcdF (DUF218 family)
MNPERGAIGFKLIAVLCLAAFCILLYLVRHPILRFAAHAWITEDALERGDAIVVLGDDNFYADRAALAAALYRRGLAPLVVASGRELRPYAGIAELMEHDLFERGVPKGAILKVVHRADNTREEAVFLAPIAAQHKWKRVILVTSDVDARRARYIFRRVFPTAVDVRVTGARDLDFDADHWWETHRGAKRMFHELAGMMVTMWELRGTKPGGPATQSVVGMGGLIPQPIV